MPRPTRTPSPQKKQRPSTATVWTDHLKHDAKAQSDFRELVLSTPVLTRLAEILEQGEKSADRQEVTKQFFDDPNWNNKMAYQLGKRAAVQQVLRLITFQDQGR
jgi:hypothetical protein